MRSRWGSRVLYGKADPWGTTDHLDHVCGMKVDPGRGYSKIYRGAFAVGADLPKVAELQRPV
jgi:hypothetical protein